MVSLTVLVSESIRSDVRTFLAASTISGGARENVSDNSTVSNVWRNVTSDSHTTKSASSSRRRWIILRVSVMSSGLEMTVIERRVTCLLRRGAQPKTGDKTAVCPKRRLGGTLIGREGRNASSKHGKKAKGALAFLTVLSPRCFVQSSSKTSPKKLFVNPTSRDSFRSTHSVPHGQ